MSASRITGRDERKEGIVSLAASRLLRRLPRSPAAPGTGRSRRRSCRSAAGPGILKSSVRQSCSPNARQVGARWSARSPPAWPAPVWTSAWPPRAPFQGAHHHLLHVGIGDRPRHPGRGSSPSPSSRLARNRARHLVTVLRLTPSRRPRLCCYALRRWPARSVPATPGPAQCCGASPSSLMCAVRPATTPAAPARDLRSSQHTALRPPCHHHRTCQLKLKATQVVIGNSRPGH